MCLTIDNNRVYVYDEDIIVFKFIEHISYLNDSNKSGKDNFITGYMFTEIPSNGKLIPQTNYFDEHQVDDIIEHDIVGSGVIHSFSASNILEWTSRNTHGFIAKAIIPAGTKFIGNGEAFVSEQLIVDLNTQFVCRDYIGTDQQWMEDKQLFVNKCLKLNQNL
jgi:hypothetical protein